VHEHRERRQPFAQVAYRVDEGGTVAAELPAHCPGRSPSDGCHVVARFRRARGQGPAHALVVARCHEHGRSFTLYPPGWVPYGRQPTCSVTPAGYAVRSTSAAGTMFAAAEDAEAGRLWPRSGAALDANVHRTQGRHLALASVLLGVSPSLVEAVREALAACLGVPLLVLHEARRRYETSRSWRARAGALMEVVRRLGARRQLPELWSRAGHLAGLWGRPSRWGPGGGLQTG
jgi:hypothetical protein